MTGMRKFNLSLSRKEKVSSSWAYGKVANRLLRRVLVGLLPALVLLFANGWDARAGSLQLEPTQAGPSGFVRLQQ